MNQVERESRKAFGGNVLMGTAALTALAAVVASASVASAQVSGKTEIETITVTARKKEESLQSTPVSVTAITGETLSWRGYSDISQISSSVPNFQFSPTASVSGSSSAASIFIRGIGQTDFTLTTEPGVGIFLDGVYIARSVGSVLSLLDMERIEVLRGPQGTLFGKNTIGGAINITTSKPADSLGVKLEVTAGRYDRIDGKLSLDVPISDKVLTKFSAASLNRDGYVDRLLVGDRLGGGNELVGRTQVLFLANDQLSINLAFDGSRSRGDSAASHLSGVNSQPAAPFLPLLNATLPPSEQYTLENYGTGNLYETNGTGPNVDNVDVWGVAGTINWEGDGFSVKSITSYRDLSAHFGRDGDNSPLLLVHTEDFYDQRQFSQEIQVSGAAFDGGLDWLVGGFYFDEQGNNINLVRFTGAFGSLFGLSEPAFTLRSGGLTDNYSAGGFGQANLHVTDKLSISGGLRYSYEKRTFLPDQYILEIRDNGLSATFPGFDPILPHVRVEDTTSRFDPKIGLEYQFTDDVLAYASYSTGFKGGGFVQRVFPGRTDVPTFGPETVNAYELGFKFVGFDRRVRLNVAGFHTDYDQLQITVFDGIAPRTVNGGRANIDGFEAELEVVPVNSMTLSFSTGYVNARYAEVDPGATEVTLDNRFPYTPKWSVKGGVEYLAEFGDAGSLMFNVQWSYRTAQYLDAANGRFLLQDGYHLVDLGVTYRPVSENWSVTAGGTNITGEKYLTGGLDSFSSLGYAEAVYAPPSQWFVTARYNF